VVHEWNTAVHVQDAEGDPAKRAFTSDELQALSGKAITGSYATHLIDAGWDSSGVEQPVDVAGVVGARSRSGYCRCRRSGRGNRLGVSLGVGGGAVQLQGERPLGHGVPPLGVAGWRGAGGLR
jgi:hypothetical protein